VAFEGAPSSLSIRPKLAKSPIASGMPWKNELDREVLGDHPTGLGSGSYPKWPSAADARRWAWGSVTTELAPAADAVPQNPLA
jgi:hypothetical protein